MKHFTLTALSSAFLLAVAPAQSTFCLPIGTGGAVGCQSTTAPTLTNGVAASGDIDFQYDAATSILTLVVTNTSPIVTGETNPVMTRIGFNFPAAVNAASLVSQSGSGGATPAFTLQYPPSSPSTKGCFGDFSAELAIASVAGGIGNATATSFAHATVVLGPVTFTLQLGGTGLGALTADDFGTSLSANGSYHVAVGVKFQGGGVGGAESGFVSSGNPCCPNQGSTAAVGVGCAPQNLTIPTLTAAGTPSLGAPFGVEVKSPSTPNSLAVVLFGFSSTWNPVFNQPLPFSLSSFGFPGCSLNTSGEFLVGLALDNMGEATYTTSVPSVTLKWCGADFTFQAFTASGNDMLNTAGLTFVIGS